MDAIGSFSDFSSKGQKPHSLMEALDAYVRARGMTWNKLATEAGVSASSASKWRGGSGQPSWANVIEFCRVLDVSPDRLAKYAGEPIPPPRTRESLFFSRILGDKPGQVSLDDAMRLVWGYAVQKAREAGQDDVAGRIGLLGAPVLQILRATAEPDDPAVPAILPTALPQELVASLDRELETGSLPGNEAAPPGPTTSNEDSPPRANAGRKGTKKR